MQSNEIIIGISQVATYLGVSEMTVRRMIKTNEFPEPLNTPEISKATRIWNKSDLDTIKNNLRKRGQRKADQKVIVLEDKITQLKKENLELKNKSLPHEVETFFASIIANLDAKAILKLSQQLAKHVGMKLVAEKATAVKPCKPDEPGETDWQALREMLKQEAQKRGGNQPLAKFIGITESIIRRFIKGESQKLSPENLAKIKHALKEN